MADQQRVTTSKVALHQHFTGVGVPRALIPHFLGRIAQCALYRSPELTVWLRSSFPWWQPLVTNTPQICASFVLSHLHISLLEFSELASHCPCPWNLSTFIAGETQMKILWMGNSGRRGKSHYNKHIYSPRQWLWHREHVWSMRVSQRWWHSLYFNSVSNKMCAHCAGFLLASSRKLKPIQREEARQNRNQP